MAVNTPKVLSLFLLGLALGCGSGGPDSNGSSSALEMLPRDSGDHCLTWHIGDDWVPEDCFLECPRGGPTAPIAVHFECTEIHIVSCKDLSNVVLDCEDGEHHKFDGLHGQYETFERDGCLIVGAWVKAGNNASGDGPGYGERFDSDLDCDGTGGTGGAGGTGGTGGTAGTGGIVVQ